MLHVPLSGWEFLPTSLTPRATTHALVLLSRDEPPPDHAPRPPARLLVVDWLPLRPRSLLTALSMVLLPSGVPASVRVRPLARRVPRAATLLGRVRPALLSEGDASLFASLAAFEQRWGTQRRLKPGVTDCVSFANALGLHLTGIADACARQGSSWEAVAGDAPDDGGVFAGYDGSDERL